MTKHSRRKSGGKKGPKRVGTLTHDAAKRRNIPTAELQSTAERLEELDPFERALAASAGQRSVA